MPASDEATNYRVQLAEIEVYNSSVTFSRASANVLNRNAPQLSNITRDRPVIEISAPGAYVVQLVNATGRMIGEFHGSRTGKITLPRNMYAQGVYFVRLKSTGQSLVKKIVVF
jgi:hypothetical protein